MAKLRLLLGGDVENAKLLVSGFACAVTCEARQPKAWIARRGRFSLQCTLERIIPEVQFVYRFFSMRVNNSFGAGNYDPK
mmetsp:Transcript_67561/g.180553  ORF Transcript_67561/g.180553 Transcript_67561/m.180553 type:complete len:80 (-) Transcript_67561:1103-1342(-)